LAFDEMLGKKVFQTKINNICEVDLEGENWGR
jgi:hypothetical protein